MNIKNKIIFTGLLGLLSASSLLVGCAETETREDAVAVEPQVVEQAVVEQQAVAAPVEVIRGEGTGVFASIEIPAASMFEFGQAELNEEGKATFEEYRKTLGPELTEAYMVLVVGHTDSSGPASYNDALSLRRAQSVADYLVATGANEDAIRVIGRGSKEPIASNDTREGRIQNRRVDVLLVAEVRALDTMVFPGAALFERRSAELSEQGQATLEQHRMDAVDLLNRAAYIEIVGHTDNVGDENDNMKLSKLRAASVRDYLISKGHDASKMVTSGEGETMPIASNDTEEGRASNRRVQILVLGRIRDHEQAGEGIKLGEAMVVTAEVLAVDKANRVVTLRGPNDNEVDIKVSEEARNFDQIKVGDQVTVNYFESVAIYLGDAGTQPEVDASVVVGRTAEGDQPGAYTVSTVDMSAAIVGIDRNERTLMLKLPDGEVVTRDVDPSVQIFDTLRVGDTIHARMTEAFAISVETP
ncbi:MAG: OmpA family protein [Gammaproteobacteria bacterium]|nr:OmpA family protein [Gammaproteobacteria bacterium]